MLYFSRHGEMPLGRLSDRLLVHPTSVTSTSTRSNDWPRRRVGHPTDRRTTLARITPKGRRVIDETFRIMAEGRCGLSALDERQAARLFDVLRKVRADAGDIKPAEPDRRSGRRPLDDPVLEAERNWAHPPVGRGPYFRTSLSIYRTADLIRQSNDASLRPYRLTHSRHEALAVLYFSRHGEMPMGKLGAVLLVHPTSVTGTVDTLERLGYVERVPIPRTGARRSPGSPTPAPGDRGVERRHDRGPLRARGPDERPGQVRVQHPDEGAPHALTALAERATLGGCPASRWSTGR